jgi:tight adherence protein C
MTLFLFVIGIGLIALTGRLVTRAVVIPRLQLKAHLREIQDYGFDGPIADPVLRGGDRVRAMLRRLAERLGATMMNALPSIKPLTRSELTAAGFYDLTPEALHGYRVMVALGLPLLFAGMLAAGHKLSGMGIVIVLVLPIAGWILPSATIRRRGASRLDRIDHKLPELIDLLIATVEAGMAFSAALGMVAERFTGPIGEELKLTMKQQTLGMSMQQALTDMAERCDTPSVRAFIRTAGRGESLGVSIGPVLRELSADQRRRHRMAAREKMQKAPVKMIFPLMFLIFPALMIVLLFPAVWSVTQNLGGVFGH